MAEHLRFAPEILQRLGEELVPHPDLGVMELVRNAYDADADECRIQLHDVDTPGGAVTISDNGIGMDVEQIRNGWLLLGRSSKKSDRFSPAGRRKVGEKGLGRLAALRLGRRVELITRPTIEGVLSDKVHILEIDWDAYNLAESVEEVDLEIRTQKAALEPAGTVIRLTGLTAIFRESDVVRLARSLVLMNGPFPVENDFKAVLEAPAFEEQEELVRNAYFDEGQYILEASLKNGSASARLIDWRGVIQAEGSHSDIVSDRTENGEVELYDSPSAVFELYEFNLSKASFDLRHSKEAVMRVRDWLKVVGGIHLFQRGLRVHPYGDPGFDWLDMNLRRSRSPELRPSTNNSVGRVVLGDDSNEILIPKTDRTGFIENHAFQELKRFGQDILDWAAIERLRIRDRQRAQERDLSERSLERAKKTLDQEVENLPESVKPEVERVIGKYEAAMARQLRIAEDDLLLYRSLATVGTTSAVFAHETLRPLATIEGTAELLRSRIEKQDLPAYEPKFLKPINRIKGGAKSLRTFAEVPLRLLQRNRRKVGAIDLNEVAGDLLKLFEPYTEGSGVEFKLLPSGEPPLVTGTQTSVESILANLLANSVHFLGKSPGRKKVVEVCIEVFPVTVQLAVRDSGPGIQGIAVRDIWLPGRTTRDDGTGLGLTIVRDAARAMGGTVRAEPTGKLGGAEFYVELPRSDEQMKELE